MRRGKSDGTASCAAANGRTVGSRHRSAEKLTMASRDGLSELTREHKSEESNDIGGKLKVCIACVDVKIGIVVGLVDSRGVRDMENLRAIGRLN